MPQQRKSAGAKAAAGAKRASAKATKAVGDGLIAWPTDAEGRPMAQISMAAAELIPTGDFANVNVGPAVITCFIDMDNTVFLPSKTAEALNKLAEVVEADVIAEQREIVHDSLKADVENKSK